MSVYRSAPFKRWAAWIWYKEIQVLLGTHFAKALALILLILALYRERDGLKSAFWGDNSHGPLLNAEQWLCCFLIGTIPILVYRLILLNRIRKDGAGWREWCPVIAVVALAVVLLLETGPNLLDRIKADLLRIAEAALIVSLTLGTLIAAWLELVGEKVASSLRDAQFTFYVRALLERQDNFYASTTPPMDEMLDEFAKNVVTAMCDTLCGRAKVSGAYFRTEGEVLSLVESTISNGANYDKRLKIPIPPLNPLTPEAKSKLGPAAFAYYSQSPIMCIYVPDKRKQEKTCEAWCPIKDRGSRNYMFNPPETLGWFASHADDKFRTVLCVPVRVYHDAAACFTHGVFVASSFSRDKFLEADFDLAESFARIMARAVAGAWALHGYHP